jgi:heme oxygenase (biliverdin-IX-beta and delta-forming)
MSTEANMTLRNALRAGTADYHDVVDALFGRFDLSDRQQYGAFLSGHARVLGSAEMELERSGIDRLLPDWPQRRRREMLLADLDFLGLPSPPPLALTPLTSDDALWGAAYVLEGSKLGGAMLAKRVPAEFPSSYLSFQGPKGAMKAFMEQLDGAGSSNHDEAISAARSIFAAFRTAAELELGIPAT